MAHFAQLDSNNVVTQVIRLNDEDTQDSGGNELESVGVAFCQSLLGDDTIWKQTSYNGTIRKNYANIGYTYDSVKDAFIPPQPYASWTLDDTTCLWDAPIAMPEDAGTEDADGNTITYIWDESAHQADNTTGWVRGII